MNSGAEAKCADKLHRQTFFCHNLCLSSCSETITLRSTKSVQNVSIIYQNGTLSDRTPPIALFPLAICCSVRTQCWKALFTVLRGGRGSKLGDDLMQDEKRQHPIPLFHYTTWDLLPLNINNTLEH